MYLCLRARYTILALDSILIGWRQWKTKGIRAMCKTAAKTRSSALCALLGTAILGLGASPGTAASFAYVTNAFGPNVSVLDTATNQVTATVAFPAGSAPYAVAITPDLTKVYVTSMDTTSTCGPNNVVFVIDTASNTIGANPIAVGCEPTGISITPDGKHAYVASQFDSTVSVIETATDTVSTTIALPRGSALADIAISPDGQRAYVTSLILGAVIVIDTSSNTELGTPITVGSSPLGLAVTPDGKEIYVTNNDQLGSVSVIDAGSSSVVATLSSMAYPFAVAFSPDGKLAYVTGGGMGFTSVIDTTTRGVVDSITLGGDAIAVTPDGRQAYVTNENGNTVSVIDLASNMVTATLTGMSSPRGVTARPIPPGIPVPNVVGTTQSAATTAITGAGLLVGAVTQQASTSITPGNVISEAPAAGVLVGAKAMVALVISSGVAVPNVTGQTQAQASAAISGAGLVLGTVTQQASSTVPSGSVISQSPTAGENVAGGGAVDLVVSTGSGSSGGGGGMEPFTLAALLTLLIVGWRRTRSAFLVSPT